MATTEACEQVAEGDVVIVYGSGNISGGKSTLLAKVAEEREDCLYYGEDLGNPKQGIEGWTHTPDINADGERTGEHHDILDAICNGPPEKFFPSQVAILSYNMEREIRAYDEGMELSRRLGGQTVFVLIERPPRDAVLFVKSRAGDFDALQTTVFMMFHDIGAKLLGRCRNRPVLKVYVRTSPEECYERAKRRARTQEVGYTVEYLRSIHLLHEEMVKQEGHTVIENEGTLKDAVTKFNEILANYAQA